MNESEINSLTLDFKHNVRQSCDASLWLWGLEGTDASHALWLVLSGLWEICSSVGIINIYLPFARCGGMTPHPSFHGGMVLSTPRFMDGTELMMLFCCIHCLLKGLRSVHPIHPTYWCYTQDSSSAEAAEWIYLCFQIPLVWSLLRLATYTVCIETEFTFVRFGLDTVVINSVCMSIYATAFKHTVQQSGPVAFRDTTECNSHFLHRKLWSNHLVNGKKKSLKSITFSLYTANITLFVL